MQCDGLDRKCSPTSAEQQFLSRANHWAGLAVSREQEHLGERWPVKGGCSGIRSPHSEPRTNDNSILEGGVYEFAREPAWLLGETAWNTFLCRCATQQSAQGLFFLLRARAGTHSYPGIVCKMTDRDNDIIDGAGPEPLVVVRVVVVALPPRNSYPGNRSSTFTWVLNRNSYR